MEKGKFYKSKTTNLIVKCSEPKNENGYFSGYVVSGESTFQPLNHFSEWWNAFNFEEVYPDQIPGYHTSVRNTHPTLEDFNKKQVTGPQGQIAETKRRDFWCRTVIAYTGASNSISSNKCIEWADNCLKEFDKRFNNK